MVMHPEVLTPKILETALQHHQAGRENEAIVTYQQFLQSSPEQPLAAFACNQLGNLFEQQGKIDAALQFYRQALQINPAYAEVHNNLGNLFAQQGKLKDAEQCYRFALQFNPDFFEPHKNLANLLGQQGQLDAAIQLCQRALQLRPDDAQAHYDLGNFFKQQDQREAAIVAYQQALQFEPNYAEARFALCTIQLPIIYQNQEEIAIRRQQYTQKLQELITFYQTASPEEQAHAATAIGSSQPFYLAYQGLCDRPLQQAYGQLICQLMATRFPQWSQPLPLPQLSRGEKVRVGIVSGHFRNHSVWKIPVKGWVENLDRSEFELFGYYTDIRRDAETLKAATAFDKFIQGPLTIEQWGEIIQNDRLHVLMFPEFGMDATTVQLGCLKFAPLQITSWGHPETSGMPTIDYYLSSKLMEPDSAANHYTETLVELPHLSIYYTPPNSQSEVINRRDLSVNEDDILFWCGQSLFKYLPADDDIFPTIAQKVENARFLFIDEPTAAITQMFQQRLQQAFIKLGLHYQDYCRFIPRMTPTQFSDMVSIADIVLDSIGWSGCNSTLEAIEHNLPIVTLPGDLMRGRHSYAILKLMGIETTIAQDKDDYINLAIRLGHDRAFRQHIAQQVAAQKHLLYNDLTPIKALENFLLTTLQKPRNTRSSVISDFLRQALQFHRNHQLEQAEHLYLQILALDSAQPETLYGLGQLAQQRHEFSTAQQMFQAVVQVQPHSAKAWFSLGNVYQMTGQLIEATDAYWQAVALRSDSAALYNNLGYTLQQLGQWQEAIFCYQKALELQPGSIEIDVNLANALQTLGKLPTEHQKHYAALNLRMGMGRQQAGDFQTARLYYQYAIALQPNLEAAHHALNTLENSLDLADSEDYLQQNTTHLVNHSGNSLASKRETASTTTQNTTQFVENSAPLTQEKSDLELLQKVSGAIWNWAKTGFSTVDEATFEKRYQTCLQCPNLTNAPKKFIYKAIALNHTPDKICSLCGCVVFRKAHMTSESCPDRHPTQPGWNRWEEPYSTTPIPNN